MQNGCFGRFSGAGLTADGTPRRWRTTNAFGFPLQYGS
jgi:hypothetical protein